VFAINDFAAGESVDGGAGTDTLQVNGGNNFLLGTIQSLEQITFAGPATFATAAFVADQFGVGLIADNVAITGNAVTNQVNVSLSAPGTFSAAGWTFLNWTDATDKVILGGSSDADTITGSSRADEILGAGGADVLAGGDGDDRFTYGTNDAVAGEQVDGGSGTDTVRVTGTADLTSVVLTSIERLELDGDTIATLLGTQFGTGKITEVVGGTDPDSLIVNAASDLHLTADVTFTSWTNGTDSITINGSASDQILFGSDQNDIIIGGLGADELSGGDGDDTFHYNAAADIAGGENVDGGAGTADTILLLGSGQVALSTLTITNVEQLQFAQAGSAVFLFSQISSSAGTINKVIGAPGVNALSNAFADGTNLSGVTFENWTAGVDTITLEGSGVADTFIGSTENDTITGLGGADTLNGGDGDDTFRYTTSTDATGGETVDGGSGTDLLEVAPGVHDFSVAGVTLTSIEALRYTSVGAATFKSTQIGAGAGTIVTVTGNSQLTTLVVNAASDVDLSDVTFNAWTNGVDVITINGTAAGESLTGSNKNDTIVGGDGDDIMHGGDGDDVFRYTGFNQAPGAETLDGGNGIDIIRSITTQDFSLATLTSIEGIEFTTGGGPCELIFRADQFGGAGISDTVAVTGNLSDTRVRVHLSAPATFSAAGWTFSNWTDASDVVGVFGSSGLDTITGSSREDLIRGHAGADILSGGDGDDRFLYGTGEAEAGEQISGGAGTDTLFISNIASFVDTAVSGVERVEFAVDFVPTAATFKGTQVGAGNITQVVGSTEADAFVVEAASDVDLSGVTFTSWTAGDDTVTINGTAAAETLTGSSRNDTINGGGGSDTTVLSGNHSSYTFQLVGDSIVLSGPDGTDTLSSIERLQFADSTIDLDDGNALFDTAFYLSQNPDVFQAGVNALAHFNTVGFDEGRDPNAFFDTSGYLAVNTDVAASGVNPLDHFHQFGWKEGRDPSAGFDTRLYLLDNPDVAAAGVDPLEHFLNHGIAEGRQAFAAIGQSIVGGFDFEFYLLNNPDVAAAGVDALTHFNAVGRFEGRNPNAWFDTAGYLSHYTDVAAAGINPLQHYETVGWTEGRDPSAGFDTLGYLAANPDVAAANINPLDHFLKFGIYEGRAAVNDGVFF
jgi:Ca2+-binding RTX toxin-like protein